MFQEVSDQRIQPVHSDLAPAIPEQNLSIPVNTLSVLVVAANDDEMRQVLKGIENFPFHSLTIILKDKHEGAGLKNSDSSHSCNDDLLESDFDQKDILLLTATSLIHHPEMIARAKDVGLLIFVPGNEPLSDFRFADAGDDRELLLLPHLQNSRQLSARLRKLISALPRENGERILDFHRPVSPGESHQLEAEHLLSDRKTGRLWGNIARFSVPVFALMLIVHFVISYIPVRELAAGFSEWYQTLDPNFHWMVLAGFLAQIVDGALGMGYGVTSTTILLSSGVNIAAISGSVHTAEIFSSGASGYSHYRFGNVNKKLFKALLIPGVLGAVAGAILLSYLGETHADLVRPLLACYTLFLGVKILVNAFRKRRRQKKFRRHGMLAGAGGFLDSFGGGGWGPLVTTTLITKGRSPKYVIGSVSLTEFFVTFASALTFFAVLGVSHWQVILALIVGGLLAAPVAALLVGKLPRKTTLVLLGALVIFWSIRILVGLL